MNAKNSLHNVVDEGLKYRMVWVHLMIYGVRTAMCVSATSEMSERLRYVCVRCLKIWYYRLK